MGTAAVEARVITQVENPVDVNGNPLLRGGCYYGLIILCFNIDGQNRGCVIECVNGADFEVHNFGWHIITSATIDFFAFGEVKDCNLLVIGVAEDVEKVIDGFVHRVYPLVLIDDLPHIVMVGVIVNG